MNKESDIEMAIQRHLSRAQRLRAVQQIISEDPEIVPELLDILQHQGQANEQQPASVDAPSLKRRRTSSQIQLEKVLAYFRRNANTLASVAEIAAATGLTRNTVNSLFYNSSQKQFFRSLRVGPKRMLWQVKERTEDEDSEMSLEELNKLGFDLKDTHT